MHLILKKYRFIFVWLGFCIILASLSPFTISLAQDVDPWGDIIIMNEHVSYTEEDAERYLRIYHETWQLGSELWKSMTMESEATIDQELTNAGRDDLKIINGLPNAFDISQDEAICIAYAWIDQKYGLSEDDFRKFFPYVRFWTNLEDDSINLWDIGLYLQDNDDYLTYGWYQIYINSRDGTIVRSNDATTAEG